MKIFGAALDAYPHPRAVELKRAYLTALSAGRIPPGDPQDPYEALKPVLLKRGLAREADFLGAYKVPSLYSPKPALADFQNIGEAEYLAFLDADGCRVIAAALGEFICEEIPPDAPALMIGVDHSLTGACLRELSRRLGSENLCLAVFDGHIDAISAEARGKAWRALAGAADESIRRAAGAAIPEAYTCETFIKYLLDERVVLPHNLLLAGAFSTPDLGGAGLEEPSGAGEGAASYLGEYRALVDAGVRIISRDALKSSPEIFSAALANLDAKYIYVSLDLDVCASGVVPAVRFHDSVGLAPDELFGLADRIRAALGSGKQILAGLDIMEIDVHLVDVNISPKVENLTLETAAEFVSRLI